MCLACAGLAISKDCAVEAIEDFVDHGGNGGVVEGFLGCIGTEYAVKVVGTVDSFASNGLGYCDLAPFTFDDFLSLGSMFGF